LVLSHLAAQRGGIASAHQVAGATHLGPATVSKVLKSLAHAGLVVSARGVQGGYSLARPAEEITAAEIIDALEGPVAITECSAKNSCCDIEEFCRVGRAWQRINWSIRKALDSVSLADLQNRTHRLPPPDLRSGLVGAAR
jgi:FeS assembly SUF system regulator